MKRARLEEQQEPFEESDLVEKDEELIAHTLAHQPKVKITHSIPFPIALVEDKTNIVHTKALLLIHLYKSYSSPCIICVLCKRFFSINEFSKHFHLSDEDLLDEEDADDDANNNDDECNPRKHRDKNAFTQAEWEQIRERRLGSLKKKSYKILPYCLNKNNELNEDQLKIWKIFGERYIVFFIIRSIFIINCCFLRFTKFKQIHQQSIASKSKIASEESTRNKIKSQDTVKMDTTNWQYFDSAKKIYFITRDRLENERIISIAKSDENAVVNSSNRDADLHLSEDESDDSEITKDDHNNLESTSSQAAPHNQVVVEAPKIYFYRKMPSTRDKIYNYYDNLSGDVLAYIESSPFLVTPQSLISYNAKNHYHYLRSLLLSKNETLQKKWLCLVLNLDVKV